MEKSILVNLSNQKNSASFTWLTLLGFQTSGFSPAPPDSDTTSLLTGNSIAPENTGYLIPQSS